MKAFNPNNQWNIADKDGNIDLPDELFPLFNKVGIQLRLHRISGKNEYATIADIIYLAHKYFTENPIKQVKTDIDSADEEYIQASLDAMYCTSCQALEAHDCFCDEHETEEFDPKAICISCGATLNSTETQIGFEKCCDCDPY